MCIISITQLSSFLERPVPKLPTREKEDRRRFTKLLCRWAREAEIEGSM
jgi:hypothetical protein